MSIEWPPTSGKVSTTASGKKVWVAAFRALGDDAGAAAVEAEKDWRHKYPKHAVALTERMCATPDACVAACVRGLAAVHETFATADALAASASDAAPFVSWRVGGSRATAPAALPVLPLADLRAWVEDGACEADVAERCEAVCDGDGALRPTTNDDTVFVVFGATSEMGPARTLLALGHTVLGVARAGNAAKWAPLVAFAAASAGTLVLPSVQETPRKPGVFRLWRPLSRSDSSRFGSFLDR